MLIGSEDALQPYGDELPYRAVKAGVLNLAKGLSNYGRRGLLVNAVSPAFIATPMTDAMMEKRAAKSGTSFEATLQGFLKEERPTLQSARRGGAEAVAPVIAFLCSERASFVNGANVAWTAAPWPPWAEAGDHHAGAVRQAGPGFAQTRPWTGRLRDGF